MEDSVSFQVINFGLTGRFPGRIVKCSCKNQRIRFGAVWNWRNNDGERLDSIVEADQWTIQESIRERSRVEVKS